VGRAARDATARRGLMRKIALALVLSLLLPAALAAAEETPRGGSAPAASPSPSPRTSPDAVTAPRTEPAAVTAPRPSPDAVTAPRTSPDAVTAPRTEPAAVAGTPARTRRTAPARGESALALFPSGDEAFPRFVPHAAGFTEGERLTYTIKCSGVPVGRATLKVAERLTVSGRRCIRLEYSCRSNRFVSSFYRVRNEGVSLIDAAEGYSRLYHLSRSEGAYRTNERIEIDPRERVAYHERTGPAGDTVSQVVLLPGRVYDPLSCIYALRHLRLEPRRTTRITVTAERRNWVLALEVLGREQIEIEGLGRRSALKVRPVAAFPGLFVRKGGIILWLDEETRVPLRMKTDIPIGTVSVSLSSFENSPLNRVSAGPARRAAATR